MPLLEQSLTRLPPPRRNSAPRARVPQVEFSDSASLYVSGDRSQVIMVRGGEATMHSMDRLPEDPDLIRRLTFTRDVLREIEAAAELS